MKEKPSWNIVLQGNMISFSSLVFSFQVGWGRRKETSARLPGKRKGLDGSTRGSNPIIMPHIFLFPFTIKSVPTKRLRKSVIAMWPGYDRSPKGYILLHF